MKRKHYETATTGANRNRELVRKHGACVRIAQMREYRWDTYMGVATVATFSDGCAVSICADWQGATKEEFMRISRMSWTLRDEYEFLVRYHQIPRNTSFNAFRKQFNDEKRYLFRSNK